MRQIYKQIHRILVFVTVMSYNDRESGLYYLQSRYYNPEVGRFLNADALISTGQGLLGNNTFAYCLNNPANYFDNTGELPQAVEDAIVHNRVLKEICKQNSNLRSTQTCIYYNGIDYTNGWGFCDLYNSSTGEVWELKKDSSSWTCTTAAAKAQLNRYVNGKLKYYPDLQLFTPYTTNIWGGNFSFTMNGYNYNTSYWNEGDGILRYNYTKNKTETRKKAELLATATTITAVAVYCAPVSLPGIVTTFSYAFMY